VVIHATSITADAQAWLSHARQIRVLNSFDNAWNLTDENDRVVSIVTPVVGNGPLNIVVPLKRLPHLSQSTSVYVTPQRLFLGQLTIVTEGVPVWDATLPQREGINLVDIVHTGKTLLFHSPESLAQPYLKIPTSEADFNQLLLKQLFEAAVCVVSALRSDDERALEAAVKALAGKGIGLTPAGDDWLLGCIVALHCLGQHPKANLIARIACAQTTVFSASILHMAGQGKHAQTWHDLLNAATPPQIRAAVYHVL
jgi:hypothetical protein